MDQYGKTEILTLSLKEDIYEWGIFVYKILY